MPRLKAVTTSNSTGTCFANQEYRFETASEISSGFISFLRAPGSLSTKEDPGRLCCSASDSMASRGPPSDMAILLYFPSLLLEPLAAYLVPSTSDGGWRGTGRGDLEKHCILQRTQNKWASNHLSLNKPHIQASQL